MGNRHLAFLLLLAPVLALGTDAPILSPSELRNILFAPADQGSREITDTFERLRADSAKLGQEYFEVLSEFVRTPQATRFKQTKYDRAIAALLGAPQVAGDPDLERRVLSSALVQGLLPRELGIQQFSTPSRSNALTETLVAEMQKQPLLQSYLRGRSKRLLLPDKDTLRALGNRTGAGILESFRSVPEGKEAQALLMAAGKLGLLDGGSPQHADWAVATADRLRRPHAGPVAAYLLGARDGRIPGIAEPDAALLASAPVKAELLGDRGGELLKSVRALYGENFPVSTALLQMAGSDSGFLPALGRELALAQPKEIPDALRLIRSRLTEDAARTVLRPAFASRSVVAAQMREWPELLAAEYPDLAERRLLRDPERLQAAFRSVKGDAGRENTLFERLRDFPPKGGLIDARVQHVIKAAVEDELKSSGLPLWKERTGDYLRLLNRSGAEGEGISIALAEVFRFDENRAYQVKQSTAGVVDENLELALSRFLKAADAGKLPPEVTVLLAQETRKLASVYRAGVYSDQRTIFGSHVFESEGPAMEAWIRILGHSPGGAETETALKFLLGEFSSSQSRWARTYAHPREFSEAEARSLLSAIDRLPHPSPEFSKFVAKSLGDVGVLRAALEFAPALIERFPPRLTSRALEALEGLAKGRIGGLREVVHFNKGPQPGGVQTVSATQGAGAEALSAWIEQIKNGMRLAPVVQGDFKGGAPSVQAEAPQAGIPDLRNPIYRARVRERGLEKLQGDLGVLFRKSVERSLREGGEGVDSDRVRNLAVQLRMPFLENPVYRPNPERAALRIRSICEEGFTRLPAF